MGSCPVHSPGCVLCVVPAARAGLQNRVAAASPGRGGTRSLERGDKSGPSFLPRSGLAFASPAKTPAASCFLSPLPLAAGRQHVLWCPCSRQSVFPSS